MPKSRICLLNSSRVSDFRGPLQRSGSHLYLGIASIAAALRDAGHEVVVLDPSRQRINAQTAAEQVVKTGAHFLGIGPFTVDVHDAAEIARHVKHCDAEVTIVVGGCHVSALPGETLAEFSAFDLAVVGEGERPFCALAADVPPEDVPGIAYRAPSGEIRTTQPPPGVTDLAALPSPAWDLFDLQHYPFVPIEPVRACPFNCTFCFKGATGRHVREKEPELVAAEIAELVRRYEVRDFSFVSSGTFPVGRDHALAVCEAIRARGLDIRRFTATRTELLDRELLEAMKAAGCYAINFGIESGDPEILEKCGKDISLDKADEIVRLCHEIGMESELGFILGLPYETTASIEKTRRCAARLRPYSTLANFAILTPYPGTQVYDMALRNEGGLHLKTKDWRVYSKDSGEALAHDNFKQGELERYQAKLYLSYYFSSPTKLMRSLFARGAAGLRDPRRLLALLRRLMH